MATDFRSMPGVLIERGGVERRLPRDYYVGKGPRGYHRTDRRLQEEIWKILLREPGLDLDEIEVDVSGGEVTLMGVLPDRRMKYRIENLILSCWGVTDVRNQIRILRKIDAG